ncbi:BUD32 family EKC/KEOPS complex subunit [Spirabiliibacterium falconis]|uniref:kinase n=1 Tax=Spirabiliibacterium falconis TaxID=572023 RepID=UPI001AAD038E|nr:kinase [Spirabiliibacterium falconis]MBE2894321.1 kinase [Spirabiliibacterium falconis]
MMTLQNYITQLRRDNPNQRVLSFDYQGKKYWLKQLEQTAGVMRLLKGNPQRALETEIATLRRLNQVNAPCAQLVDAGEDYMVLNDVGNTVNHWLNDTNLTETEKNEIVSKCAKALADLHQKNIVHGRPALRDMGYLEGKVRFIDFESTLNQRKLTHNKIRDFLVFLHDIYRSEKASEKMVTHAISAYRQAGGELIFQDSTALLQRWRWLYYLLKPTRRFAGKDLLSGLQLFDYFLAGDDK